MTDNVRRIGIRSLPPDADIAVFLQSIKEEYSSKREEIKEQLTETIDESIENNQPPIFAFGKLLNYLASREKPELIELLASCLWEETWG